MYSESTLTGPTFLIMVILAGLIFVLPRKYILLPYVVGACFAPTDQRIMVWQLDFQVLRILVLVGMLRLALRGEIVPIRWNRFDKLLLAWFIVGTLVYVAQWLSMSAFINRCGRFVEWLCLYWVLRQVVRSWEDLRFAYLALAVCAVAMVPFVAFEEATGINPFTVLGRVTTAFREEQYRCQATFPHAIMMGLFWATLVPLFIGFAKQQARYRALLWAGVAASAFMILATASSTPILTLMMVAGLLLAFPLRRYTGNAAWGVVVLLFALHMVMRSPVWHLLARISVVSGSTGWHRYHLINEAVNHFSEWLVLGTRDTAHWGFGLEDVTNQYILEGVRGGFVTLVLFCVILFIAARVFLRLALQPRERSEQYLAWASFVTAVAHGISFIGVSYFGQIAMIWYLLLAGAGLFYPQAYEKPEAVRRAPLAGHVQHAY